MDNYVTIITSDKNWILERMAHEITSRISYVRYEDIPNPYSVINYYITYSCRKKKVSQLEMANFPHMELDCAARKNFFDVAENVDYCICQSQPYLDMLLEHGIKNAMIIEPGVDLEHFTPKLQIGVVGRTYHTGRKGEKIVASLMDLSWIDWHFTGDGWPGKALNLKAEEMPGFYRKMDYILVPSLYEGGPMCVAEALACGVEVIAPPIGWVPKFPHIEYPTGDESALRKILANLYAQKMKLHESVANVTWDAWAKGHDHIFRKLAATVGVDFNKSTYITAKPQIPVAIVLHGNEEISHGGPTVRAPRTASCLQQWTKYNGKLVKPRQPIPDDIQLAHIFNLWGLPTCVNTVTNAWKMNIPVVLSTIFMDLSEFPYFTRIKDIFATAYNDTDINERLSKLKMQRLEEIAAGYKFREIFNGHFALIQDILNKVNHVIFLSHHEKNMFESLKLTIPSFSIIHNPVDTQIFTRATSDLFYKTYGIKDYVLCVGRLEERKNQLLLAYALSDINLPLVFIGRGVNKEYISLIHKYAPKGTLFIDYLHQSSPMLASAYAGARVFCLPSWIEGASLANLEAAAAGCNLVLSNRASEKEYFNHFARYCDPFEPSSIRDEVLEAYESKLDKARKKEQQQYIEANYNWHLYIAKTAEAYDKAMASHSELAYIPEKQVYSVFMDVTTNALQKRANTGMARCEMVYVSHFFLKNSQHIELIAWNAKNRQYYTFTKEEFENGRFRDLAQAEAIPPDNSIISIQARLTGASLLVLGGFWTMQKNCAHDLCRLVRQYKLNLTILVHDLIPLIFPDWYERSIFEIYANHLKILSDVASQVITVSKSASQDYQEQMSARNWPCSPTYILRYGDGFAKFSSDESLEIEQIFKAIGTEPFILCVSALNIRKNHVFLLHLWRNLIREHGLNKTPHLICVGPKGMGGDNFILYLSRNEMLKNKIHVFNNINDATLEWLYKYCLFTVYPSLYEGWGLPVTESLSYGKICLASKASSMLEIAPEYIDLIEPLDFPSWYQTLCNYIFHPTLREIRAKKIKTYQPVTWQKSAAQLWDILTKHSKARIQWSILNPEQYIQANVESSPFEYFGTGWGHFESLGIWSCGHDATLCFRVFKNQPILKLQITAKPYLPKENQYLDVEIYINGIHVYNLHMYRDSAQYEIFLGKDDYHEDFIDYQIGFHIKMPHRPCDYQDSTDIRLLGFMLENFKLEKIGEREQLFEKVLLELEQHLPNSATCFRKILSRRVDLYDMMNNDIKKSALALFLWACKNGIHEEKDIFAMRNDLYIFLQTLHTIPANDACLPGYSMLVHAIWMTRDDLHGYNPATIDGQNNILIWFKNHGITEYGINLVDYTHSEY